MSITSVLQQLTALKPDESLLLTDLPGNGAAVEGSVYRLSKSAGLALVAALGSGRPLLVSGEPGVGKSQLARAAAALFHRHLLTTVVQPHTQYNDLLWSVDHTARLADAQLLSALSSRYSADDRVGNDNSDGNGDSGIKEAKGNDGGRQSEQQELQAQLSLANYVAPGPLWWALNWQHAQAHQRACQYQPEQAQSGQPQPSDGIVCLVDEIDKGDRDLSEGLLEIFGSGSFNVPHLEQPVVQQQAPLVILTSNNSRELPKAFVRRCAVLNLSLPSGDALIQHLCQLGEDHYSKRVGQQARLLAAELIVEDRENYEEDEIRSGVAEYLDLLRCLSQNPLNQQEALVKSLAVYFFKHGR